MKLSLSSQEGVQILDVQGILDIHNLQVLKVGINKLMRDGKNRIILCLDKNTQSMPSDIIREIAILDLYAKELAGTIVICCANNELRQSILNFSKPPTIVIFPTLEASVSFFRTTKVEKSLDPKVFQDQVLDRDKELKALRAQLALCDSGELEKLRTEAAQIAAKNRLLEEQLSEWMKIRKTATGLEAYEQKVLLLEETVVKLTEQLQKVKK